MTPAGFWELIAALDGSVDEHAVNLLVDRLAKLPTFEIESFDDLLHEYVHALDGPQWYAQPTTDPGMTEVQLEALLAEVLAGQGDDALRTDGFLFARAAVVAAGRETYERVLADATKFAGERDSRAQALLFVAQRAFERVEDGYYDHVPPLEVGTGSNRGLWAAQPLEFDD
jgi:Protein of unknown function (DUF4240)